MRLLGSKTTLPAASNRNCPKPSISIEEPSRRLRSISCKRTLLRMLLLIELLSGLLRYLRCLPASAWSAVSGGPSGLSAFDTQVCRRHQPLEPGNGAICAPACGQGRACSRFECKDSSRRHASLHGDALLQLLEGVWVTAARFFRRNRDRDSLIQQR